MESGQGGRQTNCREMYIASSISSFQRQHWGGIRIVGEDYLPEEPEKRGFLARGNGGNVVCRESSSWGDQLGPLIYVVKICFLFSCLRDV